MKRIPTVDRSRGLLDTVAYPGLPELDGEREDAWIEVIRKMDEVYSDLLRYETDLEAKNAALEEAQAFISSVIESVSDVLIVCGSQGAIQQVNSALVRIAGGHAVDLVGCELAQIVDPRDLSRVEHLLRPRLPTDVIESELRFLTPTGPSDLFSLNGAARYDHGGRYVGVVLTGRPIGELRRAYEALHSAHSELQRAQRQLVEQEKMASLGRLVAGVAHELNNPISFVYGNIHTLERYRQRLIEYLATVHGDATDEARATLRQKLKIDAMLADLEPLIDGTLEGAARVSEIVKNLRRLSFNKTTEQQHFQIDRVLDTAVRWALRAKQTRAQVEIAIEPNLVARGNEGQIHQVIVNLVDNAIDAMSERAKPVLSIKAFRSGDEICVLISDNGPGISETAIGQIFEPFFTTKKVGDGTGLGLWISYGIVREHGGELRVRNRESGGAEFSFALPMFIAPSELAPAQA
ncbi:MULTISPECIES: ATP-binding protein [Rhodopseudomonas]|uniref:sensor histidine kinase n=1 Tax=Rhodopseudomonas TaxID=1073 RepID=UPI00128B593D|nr:MULTISPECIES: ATP-binding protein [Rhodopseudomonas]MDF3810484.1 ATP-binding protein [Rhodopseudomonas sp. BAL398]WOK17730.1 ATP-binding protein [Rhodopseudomonas sp. BAL398]